MDHLPGNWKDHPDVCQPWKSPMCTSNHKFHSPKTEGNDVMERNAQLKLKRQSKLIQWKLVEGCKFPHWKLQIQPLP